MSKWRRRAIQRDGADPTEDRHEDTGEARAWPREDLVSFTQHDGCPMVLAVERGSRGGRRLLIEAHRANGPPIHMRIPLAHLSLLKAVVDMIEERP